MVTSLLFVAAGLALLAYAADQFVLGAARIALIRNVPGLVVGMVIVGFGTSAPELLVSGIAAAGGDAEVAVGNVVGSNIANLTLLLGMGGLLLPLTVASRTVLREVPLTIGAVVLYAVLVQDGFTRPEGVALLATMAAVMTVVIWGSRSSGDPVEADVEELAGTGNSVRTEVIRTVLGLAGTVAGAQLLLTGALDLAGRAGLSDGFVGATLVALGTSLPELVTVVQSARRGESDLIVGNLLGSNLFNALAVGGTAALIKPAVLEAPELTTVGALAAVVVAVIAGIFMRTGHRIDRREGCGLVICYLVVLALLR